jgi:branched-chain amino acid transport system ATP-binding protein
MHALVLENVSKSFGGIKAVSKVNLTVTVGESRALIGPNGAGKSTLFNLVTGEIPLDRGRILLFGQDLTREPVQKRIASQLGRTYQVSNLFTRLTVQENLFLASWQTRKKKTSLTATLFRSWQKFEGQRRHIADIARRVGLDGKLDVTVNELSHGENRQLELGITLAHEPRILLLDEPMAGLSLAERGFMTELIMNLKSEITVVIIEHDIDVAFSVADQVTVLDHGAIIAEGTPKQIEANPMVQQIYTLSRQ